MSGEKVGQYTLIEPLADTSGTTDGNRRTGFSGGPVLYLAQDRRHRPVVIGIYNSEIRRDAELFRQFARRIEALKSLRSPFVEQIFEADLHAERPYIVSDFVPGRSLAQLVRQYGPLSAPDVGRLAAGLAEALLELHHHDVVHGDLRPENVVWSESAKPVLIDFGIARLGDQPDVEGPGWVGQVKTVPSGRRIGPADDVVGWAMTVYFAATAEQPPTRPAPIAITIPNDSEGLRWQPRLESLLVRCLQPNLSVRPNVTDLAMFARDATGTWERPGRLPDEVNSAASRSDDSPQPTGSAGGIFARSFVAGFARLFDIFTPLKTPEPLPPFESTIGQDLHELCLALGLDAADEGSASSEPSP